MEKIFSTVTLLATVQALIYCGIFISVKHNKSLKILGIFMFAYVGTSIQWILKDSVLYLPTTFSYLIFPLFYVYIKNVLGIANKKDFLHFIPALIEFTFYLILFFDPALGDEVFKSGKYNTPVIIFIVFLAPVYNIVYTVLSLITLQKHRKLMPALYTDIEVKRLNWLYVTCIIFGTGLLLEIMTSMALLATKFDRYIYIYQTVVSAFTVYWVSIYGLNQKNLLLEDTKLSVDKANADDGIFTPVKEEIVMNKVYEDKYAEIVTFFEKTKIYTNKEVNLFMVADLLQMPYKEVSKTINLVSKKNFNQFVNEFRVEEAKRLIKSDKLEHYTLTAVAEEVGFNSRSTFFSAFKSIEGKTPTEYRKSSETGI